MSDITNKKQDQLQRIQIQATYWIQPEPPTNDNDNETSKETCTVRSFGPDPSSNTTEVTVPLRIGISETEDYPPPKPVPGSETYSGWHDQGLLPPLAEGGTMAVLLSCAQQAKGFNDQFLTSIITDRKQAKTDDKATTNNNNSTKESPKNPLKRAKIEADK